MPYIVAMNKKEAKDLCLTTIDERIKMVQTAMDHIQESANNETKSSAGDKYETGRAMAQLEKERLSGQMASLQALKNKLLLLKTDFEANSVSEGTLVSAGNFKFFLGVGLGKVSPQLFALDMESPLAKNIHGKSVGDSFLLGPNSLIISSIE